MFSGSYFFFVSFLFLKEKVTKLKKLQIGAYSTSESRNQPKSEEVIIIANLNVNSFFDEKSLMNKV